MTDFLKAHPNVTRDEYMWKWTVPQILLSSYDFTHVVYLPDKGKRMKGGQSTDSRKTYDSPLDFVNDLGLPIFNEKK